MTSPKTVWFPFIVTETLETTILPRWVFSAALYLSLRPWRHAADVSRERRLRHEFLWVARHYPAGCSDQSCAGRIEIGSARMDCSRRAARYRRGPEEI